MNDMARRHRWQDTDEGRECADCGLREAYKEVAPRSGARSVKLPDEDAWWIVRRLPECPVTDDTVLDIAYAR